MEMFPDTAKKILKEEEEDEEEPTKKGREGNKLSGRKRKEALETSESDEESKESEEDPVAEVLEIDGRGGPVYTVGLRVMILVAAMIVRPRRKRIVNSVVVEVK